MDRWQTLGLILAVASAIIGAAGLLNSKPLPHSARLGDLASVDVNNDGRISASEWTKSDRHPAQFEALDANKDGFLGPDEAQTTSRYGGEK